MPAWTLAFAQQQLQMWLDADAALANGQEYQIFVGGTKRLVKKADAAQIQNRINFWAKEVIRLTAGRTGPEYRRVVPRDYP